MGRRGRRNGRGSGASAPAGGGESGLDRARALRALAARRKSDGDGRPGTGDGHPARSEEAETRWRLARAEREELAVQKARGEVIEINRVLRTVDRWTRELRDVALALPAEEADAGAEQLECDPARLRVWLEGMMRRYCETVSQRAFALADAAEAP
jgi:hypothetical protein